MADASVIGGVQARLYFVLRRRLLLGLATMLPLVLPAQVQAIIELRHAHGIGYSADGSRILIPNHYGIAVYSEGRWSKLQGPEHDYMGFVVARDFIFTSGHVARSRGSSNPLGLLRSADGGNSWAALGFEGIAEFHLVAAGYFTNAVYIYNTDANAVMPRAGLYRMVGERLVGWRSAAGRGLKGEPAMLSAHPTHPGTIAVATSTGLYVSQDGGEDFRAVLAGIRTTAVRCMLDGEALLVGTLEGKKPGLLRLGIDGGLRMALALPPFGRDAVANIAQNPVRRAELALISFERAVYVSPDAGATWKRIARPRGTPAQ